MNHRKLFEYHFLGQFKSEVRPLQVSKLSRTFLRNKDSSCCKKVAFGQRVSQDNLDLFHLVWICPLAQLGCTPSDPLDLSRLTVSSKSSIILMMSSWITLAGISNFLGLQWACLLPVALFNALIWMDTYSPTWVTIFQQSQLMVQNSYRA